MTRRFALIVSVVLVLVAAGVAIGAGGGDSDEPLTGTTLERATEAALQHTGGGTVVDSETGDDGAAYGVEVRLADGSQVEVSLDDTFRVIGQEDDEDTAGEEDD